MVLFFNTWPKISPKCFKSYGEFEFTAGIFENSQLTKSNDYYF